MPLFNFNNIKLTVKRMGIKIKLEFRKKFVVNIATTIICKIFFICRYDKIAHKKKWGITFDGSRRGLVSSVSA